MKIAIIGDPHLGHDFGGETEEDSFRQFNEALEKSIEQNVDLIILPGDIFDSRTPKQEVYARALRLFQRPLLTGKNGVKIERFIGEHKPVSPIAMQGTPVIAIHGTHERRGLGLINPVELLEQAGFLIHLHKNAAVLEKNNERVAIYGISGVPEKDFMQELQEWSPKPENGYNIFIYHQSLKEYIYDADNTFISINDLPRGFNVYVDGHIHWHDTKTISNALHIFTGSTIITQQRKVEATQRKGFFILNTENSGVQFVELETQRPFFLAELKADGKPNPQIVSEARQAIENILKNYNGKLKPLIRLEIAGKLEAGKEASHISAQDIMKGFNAIITVSKKLESQDLSRKIAELRELHRSKKSVEEIGMDIVKQLLKQTNYKGISVDEIIEPLADGNSDAVIEKIEQKAKQ